MNGLVRRRAGRTESTPGAEGTDRGATSVEYALMAALITVAISASVAVFGQEVSDLFVIPCGPFVTC